MTAERNGEPTTQNIDFTIQDFCTSAMEDEDELPNGPEIIPSSRLNEFVPTHSHQKIFDVEEVDAMDHSINHSWSHMLISPNFNDLTKTITIMIIGGND